MPREETIVGTGGLEIFVRSWRPITTPRAVIVLVHGFNSHGGQYAWVAEQLVESGFAVYALDLRGRGRSQGERYWVERVADYVDDVARLVALAKSREIGLAVYLLGHSAGGVISCTYALDHQAELAGLVCESFAFRVPAPKPALALIKAVSRIAPRIPVLRLQNEDFSRDPVVVRRLNTDPLIAGEKQPAHTVAEMVRADERLEREFRSITIPVLILHGTADRATLPAGSRMFHERAGSKDKTLKLYDGHYHDLLSDTGKESVIRDILEWITARVPSSKLRTDAAAIR